MPVALRDSGWFVWNCETDENLNFVSTQIRLHKSTEFVIVCLDWCNEKYASRTVCCYVVIAQKLYVNSQCLFQCKQIRHLFDAHDGLALRIP